MTVSIDDQIRAVETEIAYRVMTYPKQVQMNKKSQATADQQIGAMRAVLETLKQVRAVQGA